METDATTPHEGIADAPLSLEQSAAVLERLAGGGNSKTSKPAKEEAASEEADTEAETVDETEEADEEADQQEEDETDDEDDDDEEDPEGGASAIVSDQALVELADGTKVTVADLKRGNLLNRDYTQKTQQLSSEKRIVEAKAAEILGYGQQLQQQREQVIAAAQRYIPQPPELPQASVQEDPYAWAEYAAQKAQYDAEVGEITTLQQQAEAEREMQERYRQQEMFEWASAEREKLLTAYPELRNPERATAIKASLREVLVKDYGFAEEEFASLGDSRVVRLLIDFARLKKGQKAIPQAREKLKQTPPMLKSGKRTSSEGKSARSAREASARHRKEGSLDSAVAALMHFNL